MVEVLAQCVSEVLGSISHGAKNKAKQNNQFWKPEKSYRPMKKYKIVIVRETLCQTSGDNERIQLLE